MRQPLVEATIRETTRKEKRMCPNCVSIGALGGVPVFNSEGCPTHGDVIVSRIDTKGENRIEVTPSGPGAALAIMSIQEESAKEESLAREKTINDLSLIVGNIKDQLAVVDRMLLSLQGTCLSCGEKKDLPPELNGVCESCEMAF